jgi:hypothetical protein
MPTIRAIVGRAEQEDNRFSSIVMGIVTSPQFQMRTKSETEAAE